MGLEKTLESSLDCKETKPVNPKKKISPEYSLEGLMVMLKLLYSGHLMRRTDSSEKTLMRGWRNSIQSAKTRPGSDCGSDHQLLTAKFGLKLKKVGKTTRLFAAAVAAKSDSVQLHRQQPIRLPHPWDSPGKNTGVGCHFLL